MNNAFKLAAAVGLATLVSGCGGSSTGEETSSYVSLSTSALAMADPYVDSDGNLKDGVVARTDVPVVGSANYAGYIGGELTPAGGGDAAGIVGELALNANFGTGVVTGSATNFQHETDGAYTGTLTADGTSAISFGGTNLDEDTLGATLSGTLSNGGTNYATDIALDGVFIGGVGAAAPDAVAGYADGTVGTAILLGAFVAEQ